MHKRSTMELLFKGKIGGGGSGGLHPSTSSASGAMMEVDPASGTVYTQSHRFEKNNYTAPTSCDVCGSLLWGPRTGLKCQDCGFNTHEKCRDKAPKSCAAKMMTNMPRDHTSDNLDQLARGGDLSNDNSRGRGGLLSEEDDMYYGQFTRNIDENSQIIYQGYLFKQVSIRKWTFLKFLLMILFRPTSRSRVGNNAGSCSTRRSTSCGIMTPARTFIARDTLT